MTYRRLERFRSMGKTKSDVSDEVTALWRIYSGYCGHHNEETSLLKRPAHDAVPISLQNILPIY